MWLATNWNTLWWVTVKNPGPSSISISTTASGAERSQGWPRSSSNTPSWVGVPEKWRCTFQKITYFSRFCLCCCTSCLYLWALSQWQSHFFLPPNTPFDPNDKLKTYSIFWRPDTCGEPSPRLLLQLKKTLKTLWCDSRLQHLGLYPEPCLGLGWHHHRMYE